MVAIPVESLAVSFPQPSPHGIKPSLSPRRIHCRLFRRSWVLQLVHNRSRLAVCLAAAQAEHAGRRDGAAAELASRFGHSLISRAWCFSSSVRHKPIPSRRLTPGPLSPLSG